MKKITYLEDLMLKLDENSRWMGPISRKNCVSLAAADISPVRRMAAQIIKGLPFTAKQKDLALILLKKYRRQLRKFGIETKDADQLPIKFPVREVNKKKTLRFYDEDKEYMILSFSFDKPLIEKFTGRIKSIAYGLCEFMKDRSGWLISHNDRNILLLGEFANLHGFIMDPEILKRYNELLEIYHNLEYDGLLLLEDLTLNYAPQELTKHLEERTKNLTEEQKLTFLVDNAKVYGYDLSSAVVDKLKNFCKEAKVDNLDSFFWNDYVTYAWKDDKSFVQALEEYMTLTQKRIVFLVTGQPGLSESLARKLRLMFNETMEVYGFDARQLSNLIVLSNLKSVMNDQINLPEALEKLLLSDKKVLVHFSSSIWPSQMTDYLQLNNLTSSSIILELAKYLSVLSPSLVAVKQIKKVRVPAVYESRKNNFQG